MRLTFAAAEARSALIAPKRKFIDLVGSGMVLCDIMCVL